MRRLGQGGMGAVYLAHDTRLDRRVALKVPFFGPADGPQAIQRFEREARAAATLEHPNLCPIFDVGEVDGIHYLTMPYIEGKPLSEAMPRGQTVPEAQAAALTRKLALALQEAHARGVIHRDLKPGNIMVNRRKEPVIMDFGLARMAGGEDAPLTRTGNVLGTALYMAPEQAAGDIAATGPASDVYSLGVILYELLTGVRPFEGPWSLVIGLKNVKDPDSPSSHRPGLDPTLAAICLKAIAKKPEDRYPTMAEFAEALNAFLASAPRSAPVQTPPGTSQPAEDPESLAARAFGRVFSRGETSLDGEKSSAQPIRASAQGTPQRAPSRASIIATAGTALVLILGLGYASLDSNNRSIKIKETPPGQPIAHPVAKVASSPSSSKSHSPSNPSKSQSESDSYPPPKFDEASISNTLGMKLQLISAGEFQMGSDRTELDSWDDEWVNGTKHLVKITKTFYMGTTEVTVGQFRRFVESRGYKTEAETNGKGGAGWNEAKGELETDPRYTWRSTGFPQTDDHPVVNVTWNDAIAFCEWLGKEEGQTYRLPSEAEWEYACRAGSKAWYWFGDDPEELASAGNVADGTFNEKLPFVRANPIKARDNFAFTAPVGRFRPNAFGLFDVHGNVHEWCSDWYEKDYYDKAVQADPQGPQQASTRVVRGGGAISSPGWCRSAHRRGSESDFQGCYLGFRVVRNVVK